MSRVLGCATGETHSGKPLRGLYVVILGFYKQKRYNGKLGYALYRKSL
jgi:hypothetical protein